MKKEVAKEVERTLSPYSKKTPKEETVVLSGVAKTVVSPATALPLPTVKTTEKEVSSTSENIVKIEEKKEEKKEVAKSGGVMDRGKNIYNIIDFFIFNCFVILFFFFYRSIIYFFFYIIFSLTHFRININMKTKY